METKRLQPKKPTDNALMVDTDIEMLQPKSSAYPVTISGKWKLRGLAIQIRPSGSKAFILRYRAYGNQKSFTLGKYPEMSLEQAYYLAKAKLEEIEESRLADMEAELPKPKTLEIAKLLDKIIPTKVSYQEAVSQIPFDDEDETVSDNDFLSAYQDFASNASKPRPMDTEIIRSRSMEKLERFVPPAYRPYTINVLISLGTTDSLKLRIKQDENFALIKLSKWNSLRSTFEVFKSYKLPDSNATSTLVKHYSKIGKETYLIQLEALGEPIPKPHRKAVA